MICQFCGNNLGMSSRLEAENCVCVKCIREKIEDYVKVTRQNESLKNENSTLLKKVEESDFKVERVQKLLAAETSGVNAANDGLGEDQNPYSAGDELSALWLNGWQSVEIQRAAARALAVIEWSTETLEHIREIAAGYGSEEIKNKVDVVISKLSQFKK